MSLDRFTTRCAHALIERYCAEGMLIAPRVAPGLRNHLGDVSGVGVGHVTLDRGPLQTGCTVIAVGEPDPARALRCGVAVYNGFGKSTGLVQLQELGVLQGPILLGGTFAVGDLFIAGIQWACRYAPETGRELPTFNPVVLECNDGALNDAQARALAVDHVMTAIDRAYAASGDFERGSVGAGRGMSCFGLKGGIGSASRLARIGERDWQVAVLVLANFGRPEDLTLDGVRIGPWLTDHFTLRSASEDGFEGREKGSIIIVLITDAPLDSMQLTRCARRPSAGLARTGAYYGHGSGDIALAVSTAEDLSGQPRDDELDPIFRAAADATEGAIVDALLQSYSVCGFRGHCRRGLREILEEFAAELAESPAD